MAFLILTISLRASDPVDQTRLIYGGTWEGKVGVVGGIPAVSTIYTNFSPGATAAQINGAINSCPSNQVVKLASGTYTFTADLIVAKDGVVLRGTTNSSGAPITIIKNQKINLGNNQGWDFGSSSAWTTTTVSSGATRGSSTIAFASVSGLTVGRLVWVHASGSTEVTGGNWSDVFGVYPVSQVMRVTAISGNNVTFELPFNADYWTGTIRAAWKTAGDQKERCGIEDISMTPTSSAAGFSNNYIEVRGAVECWIKNVKTYDLASQNTHHFWVYGAYRLEIRHCDCSRMRSAEGAGDSSNNYCVLLSHAGSWLIEDNIFHYIPNVMPIFDSGAGAFAYNYIYDLPYGNNNPSWLSQIVFCHGSHIHYCLFEGNWLPGSYNESGTSGSRNLTFFRNRMPGWDPSPTQGVPKSGNTAGIVLGTGHNKVTLAGNVIADNTEHSGAAYRLSDAVAGGNSDTFNTVGIHSHTSTTNTLSLIANYNTINDAIPTAEALSAGQALVTSYLHATKPTWFGDRPWPWVDPTNFSQSDGRTNSPAGFRFVNGFDPSGGGGGGGGGGNSSSQRVKVTGLKVGTVRGP